jgi:hypothetical protein
MNPLYNKLMAEKGAPRAANNPNTTQLRSAPMNLRSAMNKYAEGGGVGSPPPSASDINSFVQANIGNPQAILQAAQQYGVSMDALADATGYSSAQIDDYFGNAGLGSFNARPAPVVEGSGFFNQTPIPPVMPSEGLNDPDMPRTTGQPPYDYGTAPDRSAIDAAILATQNPPQVTEESLSPYLPTFTPPPISQESLSPYLPTFTPPDSSIPPELLKKIKEMNDPFGSQLTQQDDLAKLIQLLKAR